MCAVGSYISPLFLLSTLGTCNISVHQNTVLVVAPRDTCSSSTWSQVLPKETTTREGAKPTD